MDLEEFDVKFKPSRGTLCPKEQLKVKKVDCINLVSSDSEDSEEELEVKKKSSKRQEFTSSDESSNSDEELDSDFAEEEKLKLKKKLEGKKEISSSDEESPSPSNMFPMLSSNLSDTVTRSTIFFS